MYTETECCMVSDRIGISRGRGDGCPNSALRGTIKKASVEKWLCPMLFKAQQKLSLAGTYILKAKPFTSEAGEETGRSSSSLCIQHPFKGPVNIESAQSMFVGLNQKYFILLKKQNLKCYK